MYQSIPVEIRFCEIDLHSIPKSFSCKSNEKYVVYKCPIDAIDADAYGPVAENVIQLKSHYEPCALNLKAEKIVKECRSSGKKIVVLLPDSYAKKNK